MTFMNKKTFENNVTELPESARTILI